MKRVRSCYRRYIPLIVLVMVFILGKAACELALPGLMSDIVDSGIAAGDTGYIMETGLRMIGVAAGGLVLSVGISFLSARVSAGAARDLRRQIFRRVTGFSEKEFRDFSTASLITRSTNDVQTVQQATLSILRIACFAPVMGIGALVSAVGTCPSLSWTIGVSIVVIMIIMLGGFVMVFPKFSVMQKKLDRLNLVVKERLRGVLVIRAFNRQEAEEEGFDESNREVARINRFVNRAMSFMMPALYFVMDMTCVLILWAGARLADAGTLMIGDMLAYLQYSMYVIMAVLYIMMMFIMIPKALVSAGRITEVLSKEDSVEDPEDPLPFRADRGLVEFRNVSFSYPGAGERVLEDISFTAEPGKVTAVIGSTGSGKSTLIRLIPRFYDVSGGAVLVDGRDVRTMTRHDLREAIGYVPQKGMIFRGSMAENIGWGREGASDEDIRKAAETACASSFIEEREEGYASEASQGGMNLSGGQQQRISIARAIVRRPAIYLFDDSFSALDYRTDRALREALRRDAAGSTVIIVAQRISSVRDADRIVVLEEGRTAGSGTHEELMDSCSVYREIAMSQQSGEEGSI